MPGAHALSVSRPEEFIDVMADRYHRQHHKPGP
jgi:hypothetical protein